MQPWEPDPEQQLPVSHQSGFWAEYEVFTAHLEDDDYEGHLAIWRNFTDEYTPTPAFLHNMETKMNETTTTTTTNTVVAVPLHTTMYIRVELAKACGNGDHKVGVLTGEFKTTWAKYASMYTKHNAFADDYIWAKIGALRSQDDEEAEAEIAFDRALERTEWAV